MLSNRREFFGEVGRGALTLGLGLGGWELQRTSASTSGLPWPLYLAVCRPVSRSQARDIASINRAAPFESTQACSLP